MPASTDARTAATRRYRYVLTTDYTSRAYRADDTRARRLRQIERRRRTMLRRVR
jgi:hypothetical protein